MAYNKKINQINTAAELRQWLLDDERSTVIGTIHNSNSRDYVNGDRYTVLNFKHMTHYPATSHCEEHWLLKTQTDNYFILNASEKI